jgi:hypothetical protein
MSLGSTQPLTEMSTRNFPGGKGRPARKFDNLTAICEAGASTSHNPMGLHDLLQVQLYPGDESITFLRKVGEFL